MSPIKCALAGIDFSKDSRLALQAADYFAAREGWGLDVLHVRCSRTPEETRQKPDPDQPPESWERYIEKTPPEWVNFVTVDGDPSAQILEYARRDRVGKVFVGRGGTLERPGPVAMALHAALPEKIELVSRLATPIIRLAA